MVKEDYIKMTITEKAAYLKGLAEGLGLDDASKEAKILKSVIDLLEDVCYAVTDLEESHTELCNQVDEIDEDLGDLEEEFYGEDECDCDGEEDEDEPLYSVVCPECGETIYIDETTLGTGSMKCPNCDEKLEFDLESLDDECDCCSGDCNCHDN